MFATSGGKGVYCPRHFLGDLGAQCACTCASGVCVCVRPFGDTQSQPRNAMRAPSPSCVGGEV